MPKYRLSADVTITITHDVQAVDEEHALAAAYGLGMPELCYSCTRTEEDTWTLAEIDGEAQHIIIEERDSDDNDE